MITLYLGGARSGKSRRALEGVAGSVQRRCFVATAEPVDEEFAERIRRHQETRDASWETLEAPVDLAQTLAQLDGEGTLIVVDCLTLWLGNLIHHEQDADRNIEHLLNGLKTAQADVRLVSNEVGLGLVPDNALGREFRDLQGRLNQQVAAVADRVELLVAGLPLVIKPQGET